MSLNIKISAFLLGVYTVYVQTIMLRELFAVFGFSELLFALILFFWLVWGALGSFTYRKGSVGLQFAILGIFGVLTPVLVRALAIFLRPQFGLATPTINVALAGLIGTAVAFFDGRAFSAMARSGDTHKLYAFEGIGAFVGGILSIIALGILSRPAISILALFLLIPIYAQSKRNSLLYLSILILAVFISSLVFPIFSKTLWQGFKIVEFDSPYGRISLLERQGENYIYENGKLVLSGGDSLSAEQIVHPIMWAKNSPKNIVLVGGLFKGALRDILKHNPERVILPFPDNKLLTSAIAMFPSIRNSVDDERVDIVEQDPRYFFRHQNRLYDVIISMPGFPSSGADNRFWTVEYFEQLRSSLADSGIVGVAIPVGANYLSEYQAELCSSVWKTFLKVFPDGEIYFLDAAVLMVSGKNKKLNLAKTLINAKYLRDVHSVTVPKSYLPILFQSQREMTLHRQLREAKFTQMNRDWHPLAYLWGILEQSYLSNTKIPTSIFVNGSKKSLILGLFFMGIIFISTVFFKKYSALIWVMTGGIWGMFSQTLFILLLQANFGNLYWLIGLATGTFLLGTSSGSILGAKLNRNIYGAISIVLLLIILICVYGNLGNYIPLLLFILIFLLSGLVSGLIFGFCAIMFGDGGKLYGADLIGAGIGTMLALYIIPLNQPIAIILGLTMMILISGIRCII